MITNIFPQRSWGATLGRPKGRLFGGLQADKNGGAGAEPPLTLILINDRLIVRRPLGSLTLALVLGDWSTPSGPTGRSKHRMVFRDAIAAPFAFLNKPPRPRKMFSNVWDCCSILKPFWHIGFVDDRCVGINYPHNPRMIIPEQQKQKTK